jgi:hypothetical protein
LPKWRPLISRYSPRAPISRARATLSEATLARQLAERDIAKAEAMLKQAAANEQTRPLLLDWETAPPAALDAATLLADRARAARWPSLRWPPIPVAPSSWKMSGRRRRPIASV